MSMSSVSEQSLGYMVFRESHSGVRVRARRRARETHGMPTLPRRPSIATSGTINHVHLGCARLAAEVGHGISTSSLTSKYWEMSALRNLRPLFRGIRNARQPLRPFTTSSTFLASRLATRRAAAVTLGALAVFAAYSQSQRPILLDAIVALDQSSSTLGPTRSQ